MDAPVEIAISSSWGHALAIALAPLMWWAASRYGPVKQAFTRTLTAWDSPFLTKCIRTLGVTAVGVAVIVAAAYLFVIGWDRLFDRVIIGQALTLDYPWPRQDAILSWDDRVQVEFQTKNLGLRRFVRLCVSAEGEEHFGRWMWNGDDVRNAESMIRARLLRRLDASQ